MASKRRGRGSLTNANSGMTGTIRFKSSGRAKKSVIENARSSRPTSYLKGGRQYFGPLYRKPLGFDD
jgi:hypothetical protein